MTLGKTECHAIADKIGLTAARSRTQAFVEAQVALENQIRETPPRGLSGLIVKAKIARAVDDDRHEAQIIADLLAMKSEVA